MAAFGDRPVCYQVSILLLIVASGMYALGMLAPWWAQTQFDGRVVSHSGLWFGCVSSSSASSSALSLSAVVAPSSLPSSSKEESEISPPVSSAASSQSSGKCSPIDAPDWFKGVQAMQCLALAGLGIASAYAIFTNCCLDHVRYGRVVEVCSALAGALGIVSGVLYMVRTTSALRASRNIRYSWAFGLDLGACVLILFIAAVVALTNSDRRGRRPSSSGYGSAQQFLRYGHEPVCHLDLDEDSSKQEGRASKSRLSHSGSARPAGSSSSSSYEVRGVRIEMERSPGRARRLGATSEEEKERSCSPHGLRYSSVVPAEAMVVLQNVSGSGSATATILQRPASSSSATDLRRPSADDSGSLRPRSANGVVHAYHNPTLHGSALLPLPNDGRGAHCSRTCPCKHYCSLGRLAEPEHEAACTARSLYYSGVAPLTGSCPCCTCLSPLHPWAGGDGVVLEDRSRAGSRRSSCSCCNGQQGRGVQKAASQSGTLHAKSCVTLWDECRCSPTLHQGGRRPSKGTGRDRRLTDRRLTRGTCAMAPTHRSHAHRLSASCVCPELLGKATCSAGVGQADLPPLRKSPRSSPRFRPVCAVHGHAVGRSSDNEEQESESSSEDSEGQLEKTPFLLDARGGHSDSLALSDPLLGSPVTTPTAPPYEAGGWGDGAEHTVSCAVFPQG